MVRTGSSSAESRMALPRAPPPRRRHSDPAAARRGSRPRPARESPGSCPVWDRPRRESASPGGCVEPEPLDPLRRISLAETILAFGPSANARSAAAGSTPMISAIRHIAQGPVRGPQTVFAPRCHRGCSSRLKGIITGSSSLSPKYTAKDGRWESPSWMRERNSKRMPLSNRRTPSGSASAHSGHPFRLGTFMPFCCIPVSGPHSGRFYVRLVHIGPDGR